MVSSIIYGNFINMENKTQLAYFNSLHLKDFRPVCAKVDKTKENQK